MAGPAEDERRADVPPHGARPPAGDEPRHDGRQRAHEPEPLQPAVHGARAEDACGADGAPDDGGRVEDAAPRARVAVLLVEVAYVGDAVERPVHHADLDDGRPYGRYELRREHDARRHLHVVAQLEVLREVERLPDTDVPVVLEHHHGEGPAGDHIPDEILGEDVEAQLDVGHGLDDADGEEPDDGDEHADHEGPGGEARRPGCDDSEGEADHHGKECFKRMLVLDLQGGKGGDPNEGLGSSKNTDRCARVPRYHQSSASRYFFISLMCTSSSWFLASLNCFQISFPWYSATWTTTAVTAAKDRP